jgi:hypothetical protein
MTWGHHVNIFQASYRSNCPPLLSPLLLLKKDRFCEGKTEVPMATGFFSSSLTISVCGPAELLPISKTLALSPYLEMTSRNDAPS